MSSGAALSLLLLSVGLSMDAMAVAAAKGLAAPRVRARDVTLLAATVGGFQALMPLLGWLLAARFRALVEDGEVVVVHEQAVAAAARQLARDSQRGQQLHGR